MKTRVILLAALAVLLAFHRASSQIWEETTAPAFNYPCLECCADGTTLLTSGFRVDIPIYISTNSGMAWTITSAPVGTWSSIASSAEANQLVAVQYASSPVYTSTNAGISWISNNVPRAGWIS